MAKRSPSPWQSVRRQWRRLRRIGRSGAARVVYHPRYSSAPTLLPTIDTQRARNILGFLVAEKLIRRGEVLRPRRVRMARLRRVHTESYLDSLTRREALTAIYGVAITGARRDELITVHRSMAGGTLLAAREALENGDIVLNLGGGFHHAHPDRGAGFCLFNDVALAVDLLRERGLKGNILVVDLDLHDGDGTRAFFADDPSVHTFSIHNHDLDDTRAQGSTSIALGDHVDEDTFLAALEESLPPLLEELRPSFVFYIAGCDSAHDDRLGNWRLSAAAMLARDRRVIEGVRGLDPRLPLVILLGGGYGPGTWRYTARMASWLLSGGETVEPAGVSVATLAHYRRLTRFLGQGRKGRKPKSGALDWSLSEDDLPGHVQPRPHLLLGRYSLYQIELAVDRFGLLNALRQRGFTRLRLDFDLTNPTGQTVRLLEGDDQEVLVELRLNTDVHTLAETTLLRIEWLLIQNPRVSFDSRHPPLPGQQHPGLGLLRDIVSLLVLACQDLQLDGIVFTPAHYHIAVQTERIFHFLDPEAEALFLDLQELLGGRPLPEATRLVEEGRVRWAESGEPFQWDPQPMVLPIGLRLRGRWRREKKDYENAVRAARRPGRFVLG